MYKTLALCLLCGSLAASCPTDDSTADDHENGNGSGSNSESVVRNSGNSRSVVRNSGNSTVRNSGNSEATGGNAGVESEISNRIGDGEGSFSPFSESSSRSYGSEQDQEQYQGQETEQEQTAVFAPVTTVEAPDLDPLEDAAKKHAERAPDAPAVSEGGNGQTPCGDTKTAGVQTGPLGVFFGGTSFTCAEYRLALLEEEVGRTKGVTAAKVVHYATVPLRVVCAFVTGGLLCN